VNEYNPIVRVWLEARPSGFVVDRVFNIETTFEEVFMDNPSFKPNREMFTEALKSYGCFSPCDGITIELCT